MYIGNKRVLRVLKTEYEDTPTQEKSLDISKNGEYEVTPDDKMALSKVNVNVNVENPTQEKTVDITENGTVEITADEGYTLSKVTANVAVGGGENKLAQVVEGTLTEIKPEDLEGTTTVKAWLFYDDDLLTKVELPNTITSIGMSAFSECPNLVTVILPNSITTIGAQAFQYCRGLRDINIPKNLTEIKSYTAYNTAITGLVIPNATTTINANAFGNNRLLKTVRIGNGITSINTTAFLSCPTLTDIYIDKPENGVSGAPWGATNATIHWNTPLPIEEA